MNTEHRKPRRERGISDTDHEWNMLNFEAEQREQEAELASGAEPSAWARAKAFNALTRHPDCLRDDTVMNNLIDEIATALDEARRFGMEEVSRAWFTE